MDGRICTGLTRRALVLAGGLLMAGAAALGGLGGCVSSYAVDVRNQTGQPLYVQLLQRPGSGGDKLLAATRLGPGDRGAIGPARAKTGYAYVQMDTKPNPGVPLTLDLSPGVTILEVTQADGEHGAGVLQVREVTR